jgi:hypothetical protein
MSACRWTRLGFGYLCIWLPLWIVRAYVPDSGLTDGRVHALVAMIGWAFGRAMDQVYFAAALVQYSHSAHAPRIVSRDGLRQLQSMPSDAKKFHVPLAHALLSANLGLGAFWVTHKDWPHARLTDKLAAHRSRALGLVGAALALASATLTPLALLLVGGAFVWCAGVWLLALLDAYLAQPEASKEDNPGLVCRRDATGQLLELRQELWNRKHGVHLERPNACAPWSLQTYLFHVRHGLQLVWQHHQSQVLTRTWYLGRPRGWAARFSLEGVRRFTAYWSDQPLRLVLARHDPVASESTLTSASAPWAVHVVLPFLRRWRKRRVIHVTLASTPMCADVVALAADQTVELHATGVAHAFGTLDHLRREQSAW